MPKLFLRKECFASLFLSVYLLEHLSLHSRGSGSYGLHVKAGPPPVFINYRNTVIPIHFCVVWLYWHGATEAIWLTKLKIFANWTFIAKTLQPLIYPANSYVYQNINDGYLCIFTVFLHFSCLVTKFFVPRPPPKKNLNMKLMSLL